MQFPEPLYWIEIKNLNTFRNRPYLTILPSARPNFRLQNSRHVIILELLYIFGSKFTTYLIVLTKGNKTTLYRDKVKKWVRCWLLDKLKLQSENRFLISFDINISWKKRLANVVSLFGILSERRLNYFFTLLSIKMSIIYYGVLHCICSPYILELWPF